MKIFPDIVKYDFEEIEFLSHLPDGYLSIKKYLSRKGKKVKSNEIWLSNCYKRRKVDHIIKIGFIKREENCANIIINIRKFSGIIDSIVTPEEKINTEEFIEIFKYLLNKKKSLRPLRVAFNFTRSFYEPLFPIDVKKPLTLSGFKLRGTKDSPIDMIIVDQLRNSSVKLKFFSKPLFSFEKKCFNNTFFKIPIKQMISMSDILYLKLRKEKNDK